MNVLAHVETNEYSGYVLQCEYHVPFAVLAHILWPKDVGDLCYNVNTDTNIFSLHR